MHHALGPDIGIPSIELERHWLSFIKPIAPTLRQRIFSSIVDLLPKDFV